MRVVQGMVNGLLLVTLVRPIVRVTVSRWRKRARETAPAAISSPLQELFEAALVEELAPAPIDLEPPTAEDVMDEAGRSTLRTMLIMGGLLTVVSVSASVIVTLIRRRRQAQAEQEWVAVPVEGEAKEAIAEAEEAIAEAAG